MPQRQPLDTRVAHRLLTGELQLTDKYVPQSCKDFISELRGVKRKDRERLTLLLGVLIREAPAIASSEFWHAYTSLCRLPWKRDLTEWNPSGGIRLEIFRGLVDHLVVEYPVPGFLYELLHSNPFDPVGRALVGFFAYMASGGSAYRYMKSGFLPVVMTRKMCHLFMAMESPQDFYERIRAAQVLALGGGEDLAEVLSESVLGWGFMPDETFWFAVIGWFCRNRGLDAPQVDGIIDYVDEAKMRDPNFSMKGRTVKSITRDMEAWNLEIARLNTPQAVTFSPSGLKEGIWEVGGEGEAYASGEGIWTIEEILSTGALLAEGEAMKHCAYGYAEHIMTGRSSMWSLRKDDCRVLTVEVSMLKKTVVQAKGKCNRRATSVELTGLKRWADENGLRLRCR